MGHRLWATTTVLAVVMLTGCTAEPPPAPTPSASSAVLGIGPSTLTCAAGLKSPEMTDPTFAGGPLGGLVNSSILTQPMATLPLAHDVNLIVPDGADWLFHKSPIWLSAGAEAITVSIPDDGQQFLLWPPAAIWTDDSPPDAAEWAQTSVTIDPCPDHAVSFLGGILGLSPSHCFAMEFRSASGLVEERRLNLEGSPCE